MLNITTSLFIKGSTITCALLTMANGWYKRMFQLWLFYFAELFENADVNMVKAPLPNKESVEHSSPMLRGDALNQKEFNHGT
ncbi:hypothetical protein TH30_15385 [Thalassospira profundimaris]|uniref:Uncharacterized protein n=1 Tax=Thalassospira profundimaris TaxID=502049 RepID=A0A367WUP0_9PROT|nr:hypothetical protein TH30_15385 [Thalassospira profundimaris]